MLVIKTHSPDETYAFGKNVAKLLQSGDVLCLAGDLGAGKTRLSQGIAAGLTVSGSVTSPTFTVLNVYEGITGSGQALPVYHFDLYRLEHPAELADIGFDYYLGADGIAIIEWPDKFPEFLPAERLWLTIKAGEGPDERVLCLTAAGTRYVALCEELKQIADSCC